MDCSAGAGRCQQRTLEHSLRNCYAHAHRNYLNLLKCLLSNEGLSRVTYIADPMTFIASPRTAKTFAIVPLTTALNSPAAFTILPNGDILVAERTGTLHRLNASGLTNVGKIAVVAEFTSGLLALAISPSFNQDGVVYAYYTYAFDDSTAIKPPAKPGQRRVLNRISQFRMQNAQLAEERILVDEIPGSLWHSGARLRVGKDGKLYASTGDAHEFDLAQTPQFLGGKVLRLNLDGSVPADNPFPGSFTYSMGHRNPQGIAWHPHTGELFVAEHGNWRYDEINIVEAGQNYGWGSYACDRINTRNNALLITLLEALPWSPPAEIRLPVVCSKDWTLAPSGIDFVSDQASRYYGDLFVASLRGRHLHRYRFSGHQLISDEIFFSCADAPSTPPARPPISCRIRDVRAKDGIIYVLGDQFGLVKLVTPKT